MAVVLEQTMPEGTDLQMLDEVSDEMAVNDNPPKGLIVHVHFMKDGKVRVVDVWESAENFDTFSRERLLPAIQKVLERRGVPMGDQQPETSITEVHGIVRG